MLAAGEMSLTKSLTTHLSGHVKGSFLAFVYYVCKFVFGLGSSNIRSGAPSLASWSVCVRLYADSSIRAVYEGYFRSLIASCF